MIRQRRDRRRLCSGKKYNQERQAHGLPLCLLCTLFLVLRIALAAVVLALILVLIAGLIAVVLILAVAAVALAAGLVHLIHGMGPPFQECTVVFFPPSGGFIHMGPGIFAGVP